MYWAFGDESRDGGKRVYALACVFGHESEWESITGPWTDRLEGKVFHAADCESGYRDFARMDEPKRHRLYRELVALLARSGLIAHGGAINLEEYRRAFSSDFEHAPYLWLFGDLVQSVAELASVSIPPEPVQVAFDRNKVVEYNASAIYGFLRRSTGFPAGVRSMLCGDVSFASRRSVGIQVSDLYARETMKRLYAQLTSNDPRRASFAALTGTHRFRFKDYGRDEFEQRKAKLAQSGLMERANMTAYRKWLLDNRLNDCLSNRVMHLKQFPELLEKSRRK